MTIQSGEPPPASSLGTHWLLEMALERSPRDAWPRALTAACPPPCLDGRVLPLVALWLCEFVRPWLGSRHRARFEVHLDHVRAQVSDPWGNQQRADTLAATLAGHLSHIPMKVVVWAGREAAATVPRGRHCAMAIAAILRMLKEQAPAWLATFLVELDVRALSLDAEFVRRRFGLDLAPDATTVWRCARRGVVSHYISRLADGRHELLRRWRGYWIQSVGSRDDVLAGVSDREFESAIRAVSVRRPHCCNGSAQRGVREATALL